MKYVILLCDGMSDEVLETLDGKTPLGAAKTSHMDTLARMSEIGMVHTIPKGLSPDCDTANLSLLGYDASKDVALLNKDFEGGIDDFYTKTGKKGAVITKDENLKNLASNINMKTIDIDSNESGSTNYSGKKDAVVSAIFEEDVDVVLVHVKSPYEASVAGDTEKKIKAIENIDAYIIGPLVEEIQGRDAEFRLLIMPYFPTYLRLGTSASDAVPYMLYDSTLEVEKNTVYNEKTAREASNYFDEGYELLNHFLELD